ncbi:MAG: 3-keto-5-aminohexanoate cleavage protein [Pseudomonadota bacterium]
MSEPLLITVAPNGARRGKADHAELPLTAEETAQVAAACRRAGAGMIHLHVRDERGGHSLDAAHYKAAMAAIDAAVGGQMLVQVTTESCGIYGVTEQMTTVRATQPQAASFAIREFFAGESVDPQVAEFFSWVARTGIAAQFIVYAPAEIDRLATLVASGVIPIANPHALFVLGRHVVDQQSDPRDLCRFVERWPSRWPWSVCAFGQAELAVAAAAIGLGGHVRVGFENNLLDIDGSPLKGNDARVAQVAAIAAAVGRPLADAAKTRALFGH